MTTASAPAPLIIHIGLAKTATTVLQRHVFRTLAAEAGLSYLGSRALAEFIDAREAGRPVPAHQPRPGGELISSESLAGWNPNRWLANLAANRDHFGPEATVLLVIRQPKTWLRSLYQQLCQHEGEWIHPHEFFLAACPHDPGNLRPRFDVSTYDLGALIAAHAAGFDRLIVQKYETLSDGRFLTALGVSAAEQAHFMQELTQRRTNRGYSRRAARLGFALAALRERLFGRKRLLPPSVPFRRSRFDRLYRKVAQQGIDRFLPYQPYQIDWAALSTVDIGRLERDYAALPAFAEYRHGRRVDQDGQDGPETAGQG